MGSERLIILDTHTFVWWMNQPDDLSRAARDACEHAEILGVPAITCWEIALLASYGRVLDRIDIRAWLIDAFRVRRNRLLPLTPQIAATAAVLPLEVGRDPADRLIVATAIEYAAPLVTKDRRIREAGVVETIW